MAWSEREDNIIREMWAAGEKNIVIAATLGRPERLVSWRRERLGLKPRWLITDINRFSAEQDEAIISLWRAGFESKEIGEAIGRTADSVLGRVRILRRRFPNRVAVRSARMKPESEIHIVATIAEIQRIVAQRFMVPQRIISGPCKLKSHIKARFIAMAVARKVTMAPMTKIARLFNRKDHTTVLNAIEQAEHQWPEVVAEIEQKIIGLKVAAE
jgi:hypothetical protein